MVTIGIRIQFFEKPAQTPFESSQGYLGEVYKEESYTAPSVPGIGESVGIVSITVGPEGVNDLSPLSPGRLFLRVQDIEHYPEPIGSTRPPRSIVVLHTKIGYTGAQLERFVRNYRDAGWTWKPSSPDLQEAWNTVRTH
ncbi:hypothetical protein [Streptacidiphilus sp. PAMC 29251]